MCHLTHYSQITGDRFRFNRARSYIRNIVREIVLARREESSKSKEAPTDGHADFLTALLQDPTFDDPMLIRDILVTLLFAGRDNTQNVLAWGLYALMGAPEWVDRLRAEAEANKIQGQELQYTDLTVRTPVYRSIARC